MVADHEDSAVRLKTIINELCAKGGLPPRYGPSELERSSGASFDFRSDQFHARPLATCVREYLDIRRRANMGPATTNEIFDALAKGGYEFGAKNEQIARVSMYNSVNKNPAFYKLPNKKWGLREWYPNAKHQSEGEHESDSKDGTKGGAITTSATESGRTGSTKSHSPKSSVGNGSKKSGVNQILELLESEPKKNWPFNEILSKLSGVQKASATTFLFRLKREGKVNKVGPMLWRTTK